MVAVILVNQQFLNLCRKASALVVWVMLPDIVFIQERIWEHWVMAVLLPQMIRNWQKSFEL